MSTATVITDYVASGLNASKPVTPNIGAGDASYYYATDTSTLYVWTGAAWTSIVVGSGGYAPGTPPTVVQVASTVAGGNSVTFGVAPTNGNLLIAMSFNPTSGSVGAGWTSEATNTTGTDFGTVLSKVAGAGESTTQTPGSGIGATGTIMCWEIHGQRGTHPVIFAQTQAEASSSENVPIIAPNIASVLGLSAVGSPGAIIAGFNAGTQDVSNTGGTRSLYAGHTDLGKTPTCGVVVSYSTPTTASKSATVLVAA